MPLEGHQQVWPSRKVPSGCGGQVAPINWLPLPDFILPSSLTPDLRVPDSEAVLPLSFLLGFMEMLALLPQL